MRTDEYDIIIRENNTFDVRHYSATENPLFLSLASFAVVAALQRFRNEL